MKETNLKLSREQEDKLLKYVKERVEQLQTDNQQRHDADRLSWSVYENDRRDRQQPDTIYDHSNLPIPLTSLVVDHFLARAEDEITGSAPYFKFDAQGPSDLDAAEDFDKYFNWKLETKGAVRERLEEAYLHVFLQRACILKSTYEEDVSRWFDYERNALFNAETGEFEEDVEGNPILEGETAFAQVPDPVTGEPITVLQNDPTFQVIPGVHDFKPYPEGVPTEQVKYKGPRTVVVDSERFLCPSVAENVQDADFVAEYYDKDLMWAKELFLEREWMSYSDYENSIKKDANPRTETEKNKESKENLTFDSDDNPSIPVIECWIKRDILETGTNQEFCVFYEPETEKFLYYEYVAKLTPDNRKPYSIVSIGKDKNRWFGMSLPERIRPFQEYIDKQFNSQSYRNELVSNPIVGVNPNVVEDEPDDVELHAGKVYELKDQNTMEDFISYSVLPNLDSHTQSFIDFVIGIVQLWLGVSNLAQGDYQALAPANTATGVEATLREASKIGRRWMRRVVRGFEDHLSKLVKVSMTTMDPAEVYEYMEGEVQHFAVMTADKVKDLEVNVRVILSRDQGQRAIEKANLALQTQERYFTYPSELRPFVRPMLKRILDALGFEKSDELLPEESPPDPRTEAEINKLNSDSNAAGGPENDKVDRAVQGMGNSNPQGQNQHQQRV